MQPLAGHQKRHERVAGTGANYLPMQFRRARLAAVAVALVLMVPGLAAAAPIPCSDIPEAQRFIDGLRPGPNTRAAQQHLNAAKHARSKRRCSAELRKVDFYARRSAAADKRRR
jgi:hypothetical protein